MSFRKVILSAAVLAQKRFATVLLPKSAMSTPPMTSPRSSVVGKPPPTVQTAPKFLLPPLAPPIGSTVASRVSAVVPTRPAEQNLTGTTAAVRAEHMFGTALDQSTTRRVRRPPVIDEPEGLPDASPGEQAPFHHTVHTGTTLR